MENLKKTFDYSLFKSMTGNRPINELHVIRLMQSFKREYLLSPILINSEFEVIDGQHRLEAAKRLDLPIWYVQTNGYGLTEVQLLNTNSKNWGKMEFLNSFCERGVKPYLHLKEFMKNYPDFGIASSETICTNISGGVNNFNTIKYSYKKKTRIRNFEEGRLRIDDLQYAYERASKIMEYKEFYNGFNRALFVRTMISLYKNKQFNHDLFVKKLRLQPTAMEHCQSIDQYKLLIEKIYNFRNQRKVNLRY